MITIAEELQTKILSIPFLEEALDDGLINLSALARKFQPQLEAALMKPVPWSRS